MKKSKRELKAEAWTVYDEATAPARKVYDEATAVAWEACLKRCKEIDEAKN